MVLFPMEGHRVGVGQKAHSKTLECYIFQFSMTSILPSPRTSSLSSLGLHHPFSKDLCCDSLGKEIVVLSRSFQGFCIYIFSIFCVIRLPPIIPLLFRSGGLNFKECQVLCLVGFVWEGKYLGSCFKAFLFLVGQQWCILSVGFVRSLTLRSFLHEPSTHLLDLGFFFFLSCLMFAWP